RVDEHLVQIPARLLHVAVVDLVTLVGEGLTGRIGVGSPFLAVDHDRLGHEEELYCGKSYSSFSARTGSMRAARRGGGRAPSPPAAATPTAADRSVAGWAGRTPYSSAPSSRAGPAAPAAPTRMAMPVRTSARPTTRRMPPAAAAPSAMRMPISRVRCDTANDITP